MKRVCLPEKERDGIIKALKSGELDIEKLYGMSSAERRGIFAKYADEEVAKVINARFEAAMVSKQKTALANWVKSTISKKDPIRRDMLKKVERVKDALMSGKEGEFLEDLAGQKLGLGVTQEEAETIVRLKKEVDELRMNIPDDSPIKSEERLAYGLAVDRFKSYVGELKLDAEQLTAREMAQLSNIKETAIELSGAMKGMIATADLSFIGRQGWKVLLNGDYKIWFDGLKTSFETFGKELFRKAPKGMFSSPDDAVMSMIRADIYSRPNALNGKYAAAKNGYGLGQFHEEAFPTSLPARIPFLGRVFKASETAFTATALKMRAELADAAIANAEKNGIDMLDEKQATAIGNLVTTLTGRGELVGFASVGRGLNATLFAPRFLKSQWNTLTAHMFDKTMTPYARKQAALSTLRIASSIGAVLTIADMLNPGSVEWDSRSTNFGTLKIGDKRFDITGGLKGFVTLASRAGAVPFHNGELGFWSKNPRTGVYNKMNTGDFGEDTVLDTIENFFEGKLAPGPAALRDIAKGEKYSGEKPDFVNTISGLTVPISVQILNEEMAKGNDGILLGMILEGLGFSSSDTTLNSNSKKWKELKESEGTKEMNKALKQATKNFNKEADKLKKTAAWKKMSNEEQKEKLLSIKDKETKRVLSSYGIK